jgi:hypothetical protein
MLHNHNEMIELNPLVIEHHPIKTPRDAPADEFLDCAWQELTDKIHYLPGGMAKGKVTYKACFHDMPNGLQTHIYAPMGLDIREKWTVGGSLPGEPPEPRELGVDVPLQGLYIREDGDLKVNMLLSSFVRKNLDNAHKVLVERILKKAERVEESIKSMSTSQTPATATPGTPRFQPGSHMSKSQLLYNPDIYNQRSFLSPYTQQDIDWQNKSGINLHPAHRPHSADDKRSSTYSLPPYQESRPQLYMHQPQIQQQQRHSYYPPKEFSSELDANAQTSSSIPVQFQDTKTQQGQGQGQGQKMFVAELEGSTYHTMHLSPPQPENEFPSPGNQGSDHRGSVISELSNDHHDQSEAAAERENPVLPSERLREIRHAQETRQHNNQDRARSRGREQGSEIDRRDSVYGYGEEEGLTVQGLRLSGSRNSSRPRSTYAEGEWERRSVVSEIVSR